MNRYVPLYQDSLAAKNSLEEKYPWYFVNENSPESVFSYQDSATPEDLTTEQVLEILSLESRFYRGVFAAEKLIEQATPLLHSEVSKIAAKASFHNTEEIHPILFYQAIIGLKKGLSKYDPEKNMNSVTNYLFQWATTYARRELYKIESPLGVPPSRYEKYRKVSAVRNKLTEQLGRYASNQEVVDFFHSGNADVKTFNGPVSLKDSVSRANREISLVLVQEQEYFEKNLAYVKYLNDDSQEHYSDNVLKVESNFIQGERSIIKDFLDSSPFNETAYLVIFNETQQHVSGEEIDDLSLIAEKQYKTIMKDFKLLLKEKNGLFHDFLKNKISNDDIVGYDADIKNLEKNISDMPDSKVKKKYNSLFSQGGLKNGT